MEEKPLIWGHKEHLQTLIAAECKRGAELSCAMGAKRQAASEWEPEIQIMCVG